MRYRNRKTGAIIDVDSTMRGAWEPVKAPRRPTHAADTEAGKTAKSKAVNKNGKRVRDDK